jgi:Tfp pilus assembly protein PilN
MRAVNLIPSEQRSGGTVGSRSEGAAFAVLALLAGLAVLVFMYGSAHHQVSSRRAEAAALTAQAQQLQSQASRLASYTSFVAMREQRIQAVATLVGSRFDWSAAMGELSRVLPPFVSLSSLQGTVGSTTGATGAKAPSSVTATTTASASSAVSSATPPGTVPTFTLTGCAMSQAAVADMLVRLHLINGVSNVTLLSSTASTSGGGGSGGSCAAGDPLFSVQVSFEGLPTPPSSNVNQLESTASASSSKGAQSPVSDPATGAKR